MYIQSPIVLFIIHIHVIFMFIKLFIIINYCAHKHERISSVINITVL